MCYTLRLVGAAGLLGILVAIPPNVYGKQPATQAQAPHDHEHKGAEDAKAPAAAAHSPDMMNPGMMKMMSDMKAGDAKLQVLVDTMNAATGAEKTDAITALLTALVQERRAMCGSMMNMMGMTGAHTSGEQHEAKH